MRRPRRAGRDKRSRVRLLAGRSPRDRIPLLVILAHPALIHPAALARRRLATLARRRLTTLARARAELQTVRRTRRIAKEPEPTLPIRTAPAPARAPETAKARLPRPANKPSGVLIGDCRNDRGCIICGGRVGPRYYRGWPATRYFFLQKDFLDLGASGGRSGA